jgi:hypothetical protein
MKGHFKVTCSLFILLFSFPLLAQRNLPDPDKLRNSGTHPSDCNRATPENIVNDSVFPGSKFLLTDDSLNGYNWVNFKNGDKLLIINCGCSDFTVVFQFTTSRFSADTTDYKYWYPRAAELLAEAAPGITMEVPFKIKKGADTLSSFIKMYPDSLKLSQVIYYYKGDQPDENESSDDIASYYAMLPHFFISRIEKLTVKEYMVEITFTVGL